MNADSTTRPPTRAWDTTQLQLETLERLACGCILAIQRVCPSGVTAVSVEAKGPHCPHREHRPNRLIRLGEPVDPFDPDPLLYDEAERPA
jgi:hypothetical protein